MLLQLSLYQNGRNKSKIANAELLNICDYQFDEIGHINANF